MSIADHAAKVLRREAPAVASTGIGGSLVRAGLERADADGLPCYLETVNPKNVPFYQKLGFDVIVDTVDPTSDLRLWTFLRQPKIGEVSS